MILFEISQEKRMKLFMTAEDAENEIEFNRAPIYRLNWFLRIRKLNVDGKVSLPLNGIFSLSLIWWWWLKNNNRWFSLWERFQMRHNGLIIYGNRLLSMLKLFSILNLSIFLSWGVLNYWNINTRQLLCIALLWTELLFFRILFLNKSRQTLCWNWMPGFGHCSKYNWMFM